MGQPTSVRYFSQSTGLRSVGVKIFRCVTKCKILQPLSIAKIEFILQIET